MTAGVDHRVALCLWRVATISKDHVHSKCCKDRNIGVSEHRDIGKKGVLIGSSCGAGALDFHASSVNKGSFLYIQIKVISRKAESGEIGIRKPGRPMVVAI